MLTAGSTPSSSAKRHAAFQTVVFCGGTLSAGSCVTERAGASSMTMVSNSATGAMTESTQW